MYQVNAHMCAHGMCKTKTDFSEIRQSDGNGDRNHRIVEDGGQLSQRIEMICN